MEEIYINKIIPISTVDGIGARVSIFTQGCNINCLYCHNPETIKMNKEDLEVCTLYNAKTLFEHIKPYLIFTRGITVSGGECMLHPNFLYELFQLIKKEGKTCFVDSNGTISFSKYKDLTSLIDGVLLDIKAWDKDVFYKLTGSLKNDSLIDNLTYLSETDKIQEFIAYSIPRSPLLFSERQRFRNILKGLSLGRTEKKQALEYLINLKYELIRRNTVLGEVQ